MFFFSNIFGYFFLFSFCYKFFIPSANFCFAKLETKKMGITFCLKPANCLRRYSDLKVTYFGVNITRYLPVSSLLPVYIYPNLTFFIKEAIYSFASLIDLKPKILNLKQEPQEAIINLRWNLI